MDVQIIPLPYRVCAWSESGSKRGRGWRGREGGGGRGREKGREGERERQGGRGMEGGTGERRGEREKPAQHLAGHLQRKLRQQH